MRTLMMATLVMAGSLLFAAGCADKEEKPPPAPPPAEVTAAPPAPTYPAPCPKLRQCLDAYKAAVPDAAAEFEQVWTGVKSEYNASPQRAANRCSMSLRGYATKSNSPASCK